MTRAEPVSLVKQTIEALLAIKSRGDEILIIDNNHSNDLLYKPLAQYCNKLDDSLNVSFYHKDVIKGYKAGALNFALSVMDKTCDYIVVVDSDYQALSWARRNIENAIHRYPHHALLQFPQYYRDDKPDIRAELNHYFSHRLHQKTNKSHALSTGTFAVIKKQALISVGGWRSHSLTEDAHMGVLLHLNGFKTQYIPEVIATGVLPQTMADLIAQRRRWIYGNMQVLNRYPITLFTYLLCKSGLEKRSVYANVTPQQSNAQPLMKAPFNDASIDNSSLDIKHIRAHISQLSAWVNFTGVFIGWHGVCIGMLVCARVLNVPTLVKPALRGLTKCYSAYGIFMGRRLMAYILDSKALKMPSDLKYKHRLSRVGRVKPVEAKHKKFANKQQVKRGGRNLSRHLGFKKVKTGFQKVKKVPAKLKGWLQRNALINKNDRNLQKSSNSPSKSKKHSKPSPHVKSIHYSQSIHESQTTPIINRVRAWLIHLSFWELGALSWLPVLWGQEKPFICTPKSDALDKSGRNWFNGFAVIPKLLIGLNVCTAILVWSYSPFLFICAVLVLMVKLLSSWLVISNFAHKADATDTSDMQYPCDTPIYGTGDAPIVA